MAVSGTATLDGSPLEGAKITVIDTDADPSEVVGTAVTGADGTYTIDVGATTTVHTLLEYEDPSTGELYRNSSKPFVHHEGGIPAPVGEPLHWWPMDEGSGTTLTDNAGTDDATISGPVWVDDSTHQWIGGTALSADGVDDYVDTGQHPDNQTVIAVVFTFVHHSTGGTANQAQNLATSGNGWSTPWEVRMQDSDIRFNIWDDNTGTLYQVTDPISDHPPDTPHRLVAQYDSSTMELWIDNTLVASTSISPTSMTLPGNPQRLLFAHGTASGGVEGYFPGELDDFMIYDRMLAGSEITDDYNRAPWS